MTEHIEENEEDYQSELEQVIRNQNDLLVELKAAVELYTQSKQSNIQDKEKLSGNWLSILNLVIKWT